MRITATAGAEAGWAAASDAGGIPVPSWSRAVQAPVRVRVPVPLRVDRGAGWYPGANVSRGPGAGARPAGQVTVAGI